MPHAVTSTVHYSQLPSGHDTMQYAKRGSRVQRLVAKALDVERETALVVGSDNVLLGSLIHDKHTQLCLNGVLSQWFVSQFGKVDASYLIFFLGCNTDINSKPPTRPLV